MGKFCELIRGWKPLVGRVMYPLCTSYYVRVVCLGTTLTSFRSSNCNIRFVCFATKSLINSSCSSRKKRLSNVFLAASPLTWWTSAIISQNLPHLRCDERVSKWKPVSLGRLFSRYHDCGFKLNRRSLDSNAMHLRGMTV